MTTRFNMANIQPAAYKAMAALDDFLSTTSIGQLHKELIKIRASQINGCAWCINLHTRDARKLGETEQRIYLLSAWRETTDLFTEEEKLLLGMTEEVSLIHKHGLSDELYGKAMAMFGAEKTAQVLMAIVTINAWNRIGVSLKMHPPVARKAIQTNDQAQA